MNNTRRKQIDEAISKLDEAREIIVVIAEEERDYYDNMPENMQSGEKGERADEVASSLEEIESTMDDTAQKNDAMTPSV